MLTVRLKTATILFVSILLVCLAFIFPGIASATTTATQAVAQGYNSSTQLQPGMIVRLSNSNPNEVVPLDLTNIEKMLGVVVSSNDAAVTLSQNNAKYEVYVTNFGQHNVLVTNQNGPIKVGDYITISSLSGIGMKADGNETIVLGQAAGNFSGNSNVISTTTLKTPSGQKSSVDIGLIPVDVSVANNPLAQGPRGLPSFLQNITKFATNKSVSATRVYISMVIVLAGIILTITIIYSGVKNGLISLGRNPLAKKTISGSILKISLVAIIIFAVSLGAAYAVLL